MFLGGVDAGEDEADDLVVDAGWPAGVAVVEGGVDLDAKAHGALAEVGVFDP
jgi:hypothetical protein